MMKTTFLVIGGGIAGISCIETLQFLCPDEPMILITESSLIKTVTNLVPLAKCLTRFDIEERQATDALSGNIKVITDQLKTITTKSNCIKTEQGLEIEYKFMCLCTGARPKLIQEQNPYILGIRDTESVVQFQQRIKNSKRIAIVGNGGIASEVVYELRNVLVDWVIKDRFISQTFVDPGAAEFFQSRINSKGEITPDQKLFTVKRMRYKEDTEESNLKKGAALGPDWHRTLDLTGNEKDLPETVNIHYNCEVIGTQVNTADAHPLQVSLSNGQTIACDLLVSATGVTPFLNFNIDEQFKIASDGGILVDEFMKTSIANVFAAGDCCTAGWKLATHWFQMRLWTQARQMGAMAGKSMAATLLHEPIHQDFCFELFGHVTQLFGYQVVLLGKYNGQGLGRNYEALIRMTANKEYIKYVIVNGRLQGAILIGETGLEETTENLILNQLDVSPYGDDLLNPDIDIEDYFD